MAEQAQEMVVDATPNKQAFMAKPSTHEDRIKKDEQELEELKKQAQGETQETVEDTKTEEEEEPKSAEERTFKKRYGDLRRHSQEKEREFQKQLDSLKEQHSTFEITETDDSLKVKINNNDFQFAEIIETKSINEKLFTDFFHTYDEFTTQYSSIKQDKHSYFYFHVENKNGYLDSYKVLTVAKKNILTLPKSKFNNKTLRFHYKGYTKSIEL